MINILKEVDDGSNVFMCKCGCVYEAFEEELNKQTGTCPFSQKEMVSFYVKCPKCQEKNYTRS